MSKIQVVVGGQYGSEGKGAVAGYLAGLETDPLCIRVAGPNAGHSVVHPGTGKKYALRQVPVGAVTNPDALLAIAAGSEIDPYVLSEEIAWLELGNTAELHALRPNKLMRAVYQGFAKAGQVDTSSTDGGTDGVIYVDSGPSIWVYDSGVDVYASDSFG